MPMTRKLKLDLDDLVSACEDCPLQASDYLNEEGRRDKATL